MWKPGSKLLAALLVGGAFACSDSTTAPNMAPANGAAFYTPAPVGDLQYEGSCGLYLRESESEPTYGGYGWEPVVGRGECGMLIGEELVSAELSFEGYEVEGSTQTLYMGNYVYDFGGGHKLYSTVWMVYWGNEWLPSGGYFSQQFTGGAGYFAGVTGGAGYGPGTFNEELYRANYTSTGNILFGAGFPD